MSEASRVPMVVDGIRYLVAPDDAVPSGARTGAIVRARLVDELTGTPVPGPISAEPAGTAFTSARTRAAVNPRWADGALVGLVGTPARALPALRTTAYDVGLTVHAGGYLSRTRTQTIGPIPTFPAAFAFADLGDLAMHRAPVQPFGRAILRTATGDSALPAATVRVSGVWRTAPTLVSAPPASSPDLVAVEPALYAARAVGTSVHAVSLSPDLANPKRLTRDAVAGTTTVALSDRVAIAANGLLGIDETDPERAEWVVIQSIVGATSPTESAVVTLAHPLARTHRSGAPAHGTTVGGPATTRTITVDAIPGDGTLFTSALGALAPGLVEIDDGVAQPEYHRLARFETVSDADGQWRLPPIARVAQLVITATHAVRTTPPRTVTVEYPRREQRLDLVFT